MIDTAYSARNAEQEESRPGVQPSRLMSAEERMRNPAPSSIAGAGLDVNPVVYVGTFAPVVAHIRHPHQVDRTLCGCRIRWMLRDDQVRRLGVCYSCERIAAEGGQAA